MQNNTITGNRREKAQELYRKHVSNGRFVYMDSTGAERTEKNGCYNSRITRLISHDLVHAAIFHPDIRSEAVEIATKVNRLDDNLMRMFDDRKAGRGLLDFDFDGLIELMEKLDETTGKTEKEGLDMIRDHLILCFIRLECISKWASYLTIMEEIDDFEFEATAQMFSADGTEQLDGPMDEEVKDIRKTLKMERWILSEYVKSEPGSKEEDEYLKQAEKFDLLAKLIAERKVDEFFKKAEEVAAAD